MDNNQEQLYTRGFNHGYLLAKHLPELMNTLRKGIQTSNEYFQGFFSGENEWKLEHSKILLNDLSKLRSKSKSRDRNLERDE